MCDFNLYFFMILSKCAFSIIIIVLFVLSLIKCLNLWKNNDNRIVDIKTKSDELFQSGFADEKSFELMKELLKSGREEQIAAYKDSVELFKWYVAEVIAMIGLLCTIWIAKM